MFGYQLPHIKTFNNQLQFRIQYGRHEKSVCTNIKKYILVIVYVKGVVMQAKRLGQRIWPTYVDPDLGSSLFASL